MLFAGLRSVRMVKTCSFQIVIYWSRSPTGLIATLMETLALNFGYWVTKSVFLTHTELFNNWRPKDNFRFDLISDRQEKSQLVCRCAVVTRLPASGKLVPSTLRLLKPSSVGKITLARVIQKQHVERASRKIPRGVSWKRSERLTRVPETCKLLAGMAMWSFPDCGSLIEKQASKKSRSWKLASCPTTLGLPKSILWLFWWAWQEILESWSNIATAPLCSVIRSLLTGSQQGRKKIRRASEWESERSDSHFLLTRPL